MVTRPWRSGFCNASNPPTSHALCSGATVSHGVTLTCSCDCHAVGELSATTLRVYADVAQGTDEWHDLRRGMITASVVGKLVTSKTLAVANNPDQRGLLALLVAERVTGWTDPTYTSDDMWRGVECEPIARDLYGGLHAAVTEVGFMVREGEGWRLGYSPDGLVGDDGLIEVKSPRSKTHLRTIIDGQVPPQYVAQCQAGLLVSGRSWIDYVSYCGGMPLFVRRVLPDPAWHEAIVAACQAFEAAAAEMQADYETRASELPPTERTTDGMVI